MTVVTDAQELFTLSEQFEETILLVGCSVLIVAMKHKTTVSVHLRTMQTRRHCLGKLCSPLSPVQLL